MQRTLPGKPYSHADCTQKSRSSDYPYTRMQRRTPEVPHEVSPERQSQTQTQNQTQTQPRHKPRPRPNPDLDLDPDPDPDPDPDLDLDPGPGPDPDPDNGGGATSQVVSLGSGIQCAGADRIHPDGLSLHNSHAEVLARRALTEMGRCCRWCPSARARSARGPTASIPTASASTTATRRFSPAARCSRACTPTCTPTLHPSSRPPPQIGPSWMKASTTPTRC
jgi:hypothetical protein